MDQNRRLPNGALLYLTGIAPQTTKQAMLDALAREGLHLDPDRIEIRSHGVAIMSLPTDITAELLNKLCCVELGHAEPLLAQAKREEKTRAEAWPPAGVMRK